MEKVRYIVVLRITDEHSFRTPRKNGRIDSILFLFIPDDFFEEGIETADYKGDDIRISASALSDLSFGKSGSIFDFYKKISKVCGCLCEWTATAFYACFAGFSARKLYILLSGRF